MSIFERRISALRSSLRGGEGFLVTDITNVRYLTGFTGSSGFVFLTKSEAVFATDPRYAEQARSEAAFDRIVIEKKNRAASVRGLMRKTGSKKLRFESTVSYEFFKRLSSAGPLRAVRGAVEKLRAVKDAQEAALIAEAVRRAQEAFLGVRPRIRAGATERAIALRLEEGLKRNGCRRLPFDIIVASGRNSALPHAAVTEKRLAPGDMVVIDWGGEAGGYFSDMTRTLLIRGKDMGRKLEICGLVLEANRKGIGAVRAGAAPGDIDKAARDVIKRGGYGAFFGHSLGHGVGLQVHEPPYIRRGGKRPVKEGMVFTVEPGIYVPGLGGARIEDMVRVGRKKAELLTSLPAEPEIIS